MTSGRRAHPPAVRPATCAGLFFPGAACARGRVRAEVEPRSARAPSVEKSSTHSPSTTDSSKHTESPAARERASWVSENVVGAWTRPAAPSLVRRGGFWPAEGSRPPHAPGFSGDESAVPTSREAPPRWRLPTQKLTKGVAIIRLGCRFSSCLPPIVVSDHCACASCRRKPFTLHFMSTSVWGGDPRSGHRTATMPCLHVRDCV